MDLTAVGVVDGAQIRAGGPRRPIPAVVVGEHGRVVVGVPTHVVVVAGRVAQVVVDLEQLDGRERAVGGRGAVMRVQTESEQSRHAEMGGARKVGEGNSQKGRG